MAWRTTLKANSARKILISTQVDSEHYAIPYNKPTGRIRNEVFVEGLHMKPAYGQFILWPKEVVEEVVECNSEDGVRIELTVRYSIYRGRRASTSSRRCTRSTKMIRTRSSSTSTTRCWRGRRARPSGTAARNTPPRNSRRSAASSRPRSTRCCRAALDRFMHTDVIDVQLVYIKRPPEYESEVDAKESARNDIDKANNERAQAITQAQTKLLAAETAANKTLDTARTAAQNTLVAATAEASVLTTRDGGGDLQEA